MSNNQRRWSEFGVQVNRLVYALAGRKYQGAIACANREVAERIHYSETSVRMMRQGRFRPQEDEAIEKLVEIGCQEAELSRVWASRLLYSSRHPAPEAVLRRIYCPADDPTPAVYPERSDPPFSLYTLRVVACLFGSLAAALIWAYLIYPGYPPPHELAAAYEAAWGALIGLGIAAGIAAADRIQAGKGSAFSWRNWGVYFSLPAGGLTGALLWNLLGSRFFQPGPALPLQSGSLETFAFGALYGLGFFLAAAASRAVWAGKPNKGQELLGIFILVPLSGLSAWVGWRLASGHLAFANQKDVDLFVGILLRFGLILGASRALPAARPVPARVDLGQSL